MLHDPQHEIRHLLAGDGFCSRSSCRGCSLWMRSPRSRRSSRNLERPWLGPFRMADHELLVPRAAARQPRADSAAPQEQLDGVLVFSSADPLRFTSELASDFLAHLGVVAAICLENAVNRARLVRSGLTDFLTGFHNRRYLHARLCEELARAQRDISRSHA